MPAIIVQLDDDAEHMALCGCAYDALLELPFDRLRANVLG